MDYSFDPCKCKDLDYDSSEDLRRVLSRDKHARVEGICTEAFFIRDLLEQSFHDFSRDWWFTTNGKNYEVLKFIIDLKHVSSLDFKLLTFFAEKDVPSTIVCFDGSKREFRFVPFDNLLANVDFAAYWEHNSESYPRRTTNAPMPSPLQRQESRLRQATEFLENFGILKEAAIERLFANCWLNSDFYWDIDAFVLHNGNFIAFEVKQKFPTRKGTFGLNKGLCKLFTFLSELGITVVHVILTKPIHDEKFPAIDLYTKEEYRRLSTWIAARFDRSILSREAQLLLQRHQFSLLAPLIILISIQPVFIF